MHRYEKADGTVIYSDSTLVPELVEYGTPTKLVSVQGAPEKLVKLAQAHEARYNGRHPKESLYAIIEANGVGEGGGLINPTLIRPEHRQLAKVLFGLVQGMKRSRKVWVDVMVHIPEYFMGEEAKAAWKQAKDLKFVQSGPHNTLALSWAAAQDKAFTDKWQAKSYQFEDAPLQSHVAADEFDPTLCPLKWSSTRCVDSWVHKKKITVSMTTLYRRSVTVDRVPEPIERVDYNVESLRSRLFLNKRPSPTLLVVSREGKLNMMPYGGHIQCRVFRPFASFEMNELFWVGASLEKGRTHTRIWHADEGEDTIIRLDELCSYAAPYRGCTYESFATSSTNLDVIVLVHPIPHPRFLDEARARAKEVLHVAIKYEAPAPPPPPPAAPAKSKGEAKGEAQAEEKPPKAKKLKPLKTEVV